MGPTASGKTALAMELVKNFPFEIISVDSAMIYRGMNIGSAKPSAAELEIAPHHLIDIIDPIDSYNVASFCKDAHSWCEDILHRGKMPLLVGGTMMYFNALQFGLSQIPESNPDVRAHLLGQSQKEGIESLYKKLVAVDPKLSARIQPQDKQRIIRALEVFQLTGLPLSHFQSLDKKNAHPKYSYTNLVLMPKNRNWLHERIEIRFQHMITEGLIAEVEGLLAKWPLTLNHPSMRSVGYKQVMLYLANTISKDELVYKGIVATRQVAKRQMTWLREWPNSIKIAPESDKLYQEVENLIRIR